jgi:hypothetical protein
MLTHKWFYFLLVGALMIAPIHSVFAQAQTTVAVVDNSPNHPPQPHSQNFSTTLTATVNNPVNFGVDDHRPNLDVVRD